MMRLHFFRAAALFALVYSLCAGVMSQPPETSPAALEEIGVAFPQGSLQYITQPVELHSATLTPQKHQLLFSLDSNDSPQEELRLKQLKMSLTSNVPYRLQARPQPNGEILLNKPQLEYLAVWQDSKNILTGDKFKQFNQLVGEIPVESMQLPKESRDALERETVTLLVAEDTPAAERERIRELFYLQIKSYGGDQQILFTIFEQSRDNCLAACAIQQTGRTEPHGSGVLIGKNVILTCGHNFSQIQNGPLACEAVFRFTKKNSGATFKITEELYKSPTLDFCLLLLGDLVKDETDDAPYQLPVAPRLGHLPELAENEGVYVAGHPQGAPLSIALNGKVVYPYWVKDKAQISRLRERTLLHLFENHEDYHTHEPQYRGRVNDFFTASYQGDETNGYHFAPAGFPTVGADPDTKKGDSGAPVFDIQRNSVIGLLRAGKPEFNLPQGANYVYYEHVIPISRIIDELNAKVANWKTDYGVKFVGE